MLPSCPVIVDVNDLESDKLAAELLVRRAEGVPRGPAARFRNEVALLQGRWNVRAWLHFDKGITKVVDRSLVCSEAARRAWSSSRPSRRTWVYVSAVTERDRWPTRAPISAQVSPCRCQRLMRRWRRSCGDQVGVPEALQARAIAVRSRS